MSKRPRPPAPTPTVFVQLLPMPGTKVLFWAVGECPYCGARHYHAAGTATGDPLERLGEVQAPCGQGAYMLALPPRPAKKKSRKARRRAAWEGQEEDW